MPNSSAVLLPDGVRGGETFHRVGGRHPYVQDRHVRAGVPYERKQRARVRRLADHLEPGEGEQFDQGRPTGLRRSGSRQCGAIHHPLARVHGVPGRSVDVGDGRSGQRGPHDALIDAHENAIGHSKQQTNGARI